MPSRIVNGVVVHGEDADALSNRTVVASTTTYTKDVAAVITCHNYERYLVPCLETVCSQTIPFREVVVVDDSSEDQKTIERIVGMFSDVRYVRVEFRDACRSRDYGASLTSAPLLVNVDADNTLSPTFLETLLPHLKDGRAALAYAAAEAIDEFGNVLGPYTSIQPTTRDELRRENRIDTCCLVRRDAIENAGGWGPGSGPGRFHDWNLWVRVTGLGWPVVYCPETLWQYRQHATSMTARKTAEEDHATRCRIMQENFRLCVVTTFCGRKWALQRTLESYQRLGWPVEHLHMIAVDNSCDEDFGDVLRRSLQQTCGGWAGVTVLRDKATAPQGATAAEFAASADLRTRYQFELGKTVRRLYAEEVAGATPANADLVFTLEDDVELVTDDVLPNLLSALYPNTASVGGVVNLRYTDRTDPGPIAWQVVSEAPWRSTRAVDPGPKAKPFEVGGIAYGCTLWRAEVWRTLQPHRLLLNDVADAPPWHDLVFSSDIRRSGWKQFLHPGVRTRHWREDGTWV